MSGPTASVALNTPGELAMRTSYVRAHPMASSPHPPSSSLRIATHRLRLIIYIQMNARAARTTSTPTSSGPSRSISAGGFWSKYRFVPVNHA